MNQRISDKYFPTRLKIIFINRLWQFKILLDPSEKQFRTDLYSFPQCFKSYEFSNVMLQGIRIPNSSVYHLFAGSDCYCTILCWRVMQRDQDPNISGNMSVKGIIHKWSGSLKAVFTTYLPGSDCYCTILCWGVMDRNKFAERIFSPLNFAWLLDNPKMKWIMLHAYRGNTIVRSMMHYGQIS